MPILARLSIRLRLFVLIALAVLGLTVVGGAGVVGLRTTSDAVTELGENRLQAAVALSAIHSALYKLRESDREVLRYGTDYNTLDVFSNLVADRGEAMAAFRDGWKQYEQIAKQRDEANAWALLKENRGPWGQAESMLDPILASLAKAHDLPQHQAMFADYSNRFAETDYTFSHLSGLLDSLLAINGKSGNEATRAAAATSSTTLTIMLGASAVVILLILICGTLIVGSVTRPLHTMQQAIVAIERDSDFTRRVEIFSQDEIGRTISAVNSLLSRVQVSFKEILGGIGQVSSSAQALASASQQVASSSSDQSASSSAMAASVQEMSSSIAQISESSGRALKLAQMSGDISSEGGKIITQSVAEMARIADAVTVTSTTISKLEHHSQQISTIVQVIKELAEQTNLLALNAAIEAARAGEQGRGFAVVADEVRKLAERTTNSTQVISGVINQIQTATGEAALQMKSIVSDVTVGKDLVDKAGQRVAEIRSSAEQVIEAVNEISGSLYEQRRASESISMNVESVAQKSDANSAAATDAASAAFGLETLAGRMSATICQFRV